jgi:hypothetical protein
MSQTATDTIVSGKLLESDDERIVLGIPHSDYQLHLAPVGPVTADAHGQVRGTIASRAQRVDIIESGGRYIEPVYGRPRRIQGRIIGADATANSITVHAGLVIAATLMAPQKTTDFARGQMVSFDVYRGATFTPA